MKLLLDTHVLFWAMLDRQRLSPALTAVMQDPVNDVHASLASAWEMAIKIGLGKWPEAEPLLAKLEAELAVPGFRLLPISLAHVRAAGLMSSPHRDPFDHLLAAQAQIEGLTLVTADPKVQALAATWLW